MDLKEQFIAQGYQSIMLATTSNHNSSFIRLPDKSISGQKCMSFSVANDEIAGQIIRLLDSISSTIFVDVERKQEIDLYQIALENSVKANIQEVKPNDLAMEAADILISKSLSNKQSNILIVGTGNIGIKLAIRLAERNYNVFLHGRDSSKVDNFVESINMMLPKYSPRIRKWQKENVHLLCSVVSAVEIIDEDFLDYMTFGTIAIDGGIGNFTKDFIKKAHEKKINTIRLDVRISNDILTGIYESFNSNFFNQIMGEKELDGVHIVAGGIIGKNGDVIVDQIESPTMVVGVANGIGGVKRGHSLNSEEIQNVAKVQNIIKNYEQRIHPS